MLLFCIGINVGIVLALAILSDFRMNRFKFLCAWVVCRLEDKKKE